MSIDSSRRRELRAEFEQIKTSFGVVQLTNTHNSKIFIAAYPNLKNKELVLRAQLDDKRHPNAALQADWNTLGSDAFTFAVLEQRDADKVGDVRWEAQQLERHWLAQLEPYGEKGYNKPPRD